MQLYGPHYGNALPGKGKGKGKGGQSGGGQQSGWFAQTFPRIMKSLFLEYPHESSGCKKPGNPGMAMLTIVIRRSMV